jgi:hypothetical protein
MRHGFIESGMDECGKRAILLRNYYCMMTIGNGAVPLPAEICLCCSFQYSLILKPVVIALQSRWLPGVRMGANKNNVF